MCTLRKILFYSHFPPSNQAAATERNWAFSCRIGRNHHVNEFNFANYSYWLSKKRFSISLKNIYKLPSLFYSPSLRHRARCSPHRRDSLCRQTLRAGSSRWPCPPQGDHRSWSRRRRPDNLKITALLFFDMPIKNWSNICQFWTGCKGGKSS